MKSKIGKYFKTSPLVGGGGDKDGGRAGRWKERERGNKKEEFSCFLTPIQGFGKAEKHTPREEKQRSRTFSELCKTKTPKYLYVSKNSVRSAFSYETSNAEQTRISS